MPKITNIKELRESLIDNYEKTKDKRMPLNLCKELTNSAGKIINSIQIELVQNQLMKDAKPISFLQYDDDKKLIE
jgi:hypothetical protein